MKKKILLLLIILFSTTGCVSYTELNELGIISAIGISKDDDRFVVTTNFILPRKDDGESTYDTETFESSGISIDEALNNIYLKSNKKIYLSHVELVAIDTEVATNDLAKVVSFFLQNEEARNAFPIILVKDHTPQELLKLHDAPDTIQHILDINKQEYGTTFLLSLEDFAKMLLEQNTAILPVFTIEDVPTSQGLAMIEDKKLKGFLTEEESNAYLYLTNEITSLNLTVPCQKDIPSELKVKENITLISNKENQIIIEIKSKIQGDENTCLLPLPVLYENEITRRINLLIEKTKQENIDLLQFTKLIYRNDFNYYKKHSSNLFEHITYDIRFQTEVINHSLKSKGGLS